MKKILIPSDFDTLTNAQRTAYQLVLLRSATDLTQDDARRLHVLEKELASLGLLEHVDVLVCLVYKTVLTIRFHKKRNKHNHLSRYLATMAANNERMVILLITWQIVEYHICAYRLKGLVVPMRIERRYKNLDRLLSKKFRPFRMLLKGSDFVLQQVREPHFL